MKEKYIVRDWMDSKTYEFKKLKKARKKFEEIKIACGRHNCDIELYKVIDSHMSDDLK